MREVIQGIVLRIVHFILIVFCGTLARIDTVVSAAEIGAISHQSSQTSWLRPQDEFWLLSTRSLPFGCSCRSAFAPEVRHYDPTNGWQTTKVDSLWAVPQGATNVIYVHGNRAELDDACQRGIEVYQSLVGSECTGQPIRFLVWSWPSDQIHGIMHDARSKARRTEAEIAFLTEYLTRSSPETPTSLIGYSFGARIIAGALHGLSLTPLTFEGDLSTMNRPTQRPIRIVLIAAAVNSDWLLPGCAYGNALPLVDRGLVVFNTLDPVLKHFSLVEYGRRSGIQTLGYSGLTGGLDANTAPRIRQMNTCFQIGRTHDELPYLRSLSLVAEFRRYLLWQPIE